MRGVDIAARGIVDGAKAMIIYHITAEIEGTGRVQHVVCGSHLMTDEHAAYRVLDNDYVRQAVSHGRGEYVRGTAHTNTIEGFWSIFNRGVMGIYHHVSDKHLQRYLDEFAARYNTRDQREGDRFDGFLAASIGRRLTYQELIA